jgi:hypothetical protein
VKISSDAQACTAVEIAVDHGAVIGAELVVRVTIVSEVAPER